MTGPMTFWDMTAPGLLKSPVWWHKLVGAFFFVLISLLVIPMGIIGFVFVGIPVQAYRFCKEWFSVSSLSKRSQ